MDFAEATLHSLVEFARHDGDLAADERELLEHYGAALGIDPEQVRRIIRAPASAATSHEIVASHAERVHVLRMLARVAAVDGRLTAREHERLQRFAGSIGVGRIEFADMLVAARQGQGGARGRRRSRFWLAAGALLLLAGTSLAWAAFNASTANPDPHDVFRRIESDYAPSVLMLYARYELVREGERVVKWSSGTAFFVSSDGDLVTNKHVMRPWLFTPEIVMMRAESWSVDEASMKLWAWPAGAQVRTEAGEWDESAAFTSQAGTLELVRTAPDRFVHESRQLADGSRFLADYHALDQSDLALLHASGRAVRPLPLDHDAPVPKLAQIMVLGYPASISNSSHCATTAPSLGEVRKEEGLIYITAPMLPGNSGGPLVDVHGHILGVAFATYGSATAGAAIPIRHVRDLLSKVRNGVRR